MCDTAIDVPPVEPVWVFAPAVKDPASASLRKPPSVWFAPLASREVVTEIAWPGLSAWTPASATKLVRELLMLGAAEAWQPEHEAPLVAFGELAQVPVDQGIMVGTPIHRRATPAREMGLTRGDASMVSRQGWSVRVERESHKL